MLTSIHNDMIRIVNQIKQCCGVYKIETGGSIQLMGRWEGRRGGFVCDPPRGVFVFFR